MSRETNRIDRVAYSPGEASAALGVSRPTIYKLMHQGRIGSVKAGGRRLIPRTELLRFLNEGMERE